ncbi:nicotinate phosphoribosyltransferase pncB2 [bacterium BMS3Abin04]|nr:nicotinate phosphoribosyltransferase pncB2 [bacterium BMS3Abin04]
MEEIFPYQALDVDLYELTMAAGYFHHNYNPTVTFELYVRKLPDTRNYLIAAGIEQAVKYINSLRFSSEEVNYIKSLPVMKDVKPEFFEYLQNYKFSGDIFGLKEGELVFAKEPILQIQASLIEAQILETFLLTTINFQTAVASKASRVVQAAQSDGKDRTILEFGSRRAHGPEAGVLAARAAYIAGCAGTSNVLAGYRYGIPLYGTAAHSWTLAFDSELDAFKKYSEVFPNSSIYLIDTFNTLEGAKRAAQTGYKVFGVRIDSGDLELSSKEVRKILDSNGMNDTIIILSGDLNEYKIENLIDKETPVDSFGVGTQLATSEDAPSLSVVYKLVEVEKNNRHLYRAKICPGKIMYPGKKQIYREVKENNFVKDLIVLNGEKGAQGNKLLIQYVKNGEVIYSFPTLDEIRHYVRKNLQKLPDRFLSLDKKADYKVEFSDKLKTLLSDIETNN